jgi:hypothetical protein
MINAIELLKMEAHARRSMTKPNAHTITEYAAKKNAELADEYDLAAEALRRMHNKAFEDGLLAGVQSLVESCKARRERKAHNAPHDGESGIAAKLPLDAVIGPQR